MKHNFRLPNFCSVSSSVLSIYLSIYLLCPVKDQKEDTEEEKVTGISVSSKQNIYKKIRVLV